MTQTVAALTVQFAKEKLVTGSVAELALGRTDLFIAGPEKNYGPYTVVKHVSKENGNGQVTAIMMKSAKQDATTANKVATDSANDIDARFARLENLLGKVVDKLAGNSLSDNGINVPKSAKKTRKTAGV